jgi:tRNA-specific 2-thiouridylase
MLGADRIATGHYARTAVDGDDVRVLRGRDRTKDQSYFLWGVPRDVIASLRFPVGELSKHEVRACARELGLSTADKAESQEICFVPVGDYADFLASRLGSEHAALRPGRLVNSRGDVLGDHGGYGRYTVGQRKGLGGGFREPLYVLGVRPQSNEVVVGTAEELYQKNVTLGDLNWIAAPPEVGERIQLQVRHRSTPVDALPISVEHEKAEFRLEQPQRAITPGQSGVVYRGEELVGGGRIR